MPTGRSRRQFVLSTAALFCARSVVRGQDTPTFTTGVKVVNLLASVRTKKGEIVHDLAQDDFSITENGRPQTIRYFAQESDLPLTLGLMVDTSMSQQKVMDAERAACYRFLDQVLRPNKDKVFIMQFDMSVQLRQELTSSLKKLDDALAFVDTPTRRELRSQTGGGTLLYDAVAAASTDYMTNQTGRKALIVLSDGVDTGSELPIVAAIDAAQKADALVYAILFSDPGAYGIPLPRMLGRVISPDGEGVLMRMSKETGGHFYAVSKKLTLNQVFDSIQEELRSQYSVGYVSDEPVRISEFRNIRLSTRRSGLVVQARDKYWARR
jgi:VWFA-related protein